jgi:hypothetical protein
VAELVVSAAENIETIRPPAAIPAATTAVTAFIGRALKGPVNQPVAIGSFDDYQRVFGGLWQPSTLSYAIEQYFENGGSEAIVVRICNSGRAPTLNIPAGNAMLTLKGLWPGTREYLRASVDYDGIPTHETDRFNLVVQRIRAAGSEFIEDQEIFRRLSILPGADRSVIDVLTDSRLVRVQGDPPRARPEPSGGTPPAAAVGYVSSYGDGDDGDALTNYDIIGDAVSGTGLFALLRAAQFNFLCVPPLSRELDVGPAALLVALRVCRARHAMLVVDPPSTWNLAATAIEQLRTWPFFSENALMFYPRIMVYDRLRGRHEAFGSAAAAAGMLARADRHWPIWKTPESEEVQLRPGLRPALAASELDRIRLAQAGVNLLQVARPGAPPRSPLRTLLPEARCHHAWRYVSARRLALFIMGSIERGTRWALFEASGPPLWSRLRAQVSAFFESLQAQGAFPGATAAQNYYVICDERLNDAEHVAAGRFQLLYGFAPLQPGEFESCLVTHERAQSSARQISVNRTALTARS